MTPLRRIEVARVREEGADAKRRGKHRQTNPYHGDANEFQWYQGYDDEPRTEDSPLTMEERVERLEKLLGVN